MWNTSADANAARFRLRRLRVEGVTANPCWPAPREPVKT
jgi:hypothetical protein